MSGAIHASVFVSDDTDVEARFVALNDGLEAHFVVNIGDCDLFASRANLERVAAAINAELEKHE